jgi:hypothetical protein
MIFAFFFLIYCLCIFQCNFSEEINALPLCYDYEWAKVSYAEVDGSLQEIHLYHKDIDDLIANNFSRYTPIDHLDEEDKEQVFNWLQTRMKNFAFQNTNSSSFTHNSRQILQKMIEISLSLIATNNTTNTIDSNEYRWYFLSNTKLAKHQTILLTKTAHFPNQYHHFQPSLLEDLALKGTTRLLPTFAYLKNQLQTNNNHSQRKIIIYQTLHAYTGGTTAMRTLYHSLQRIQLLPVILCNHTRIHDPLCNDPQGNSYSINIIRILHYTSIILFNGFLYFYFNIVLYIL